MFFSLLWFNTGNAGIYGKGEVKLHPNLVDYFQDYLKGGHSQTPLMFIIAVDGSYAHFWFCGVGQGNCMASDPASMVKPCEDGSGKECKVFARNRTVRWKNGINPGKGKKSKFNSKMSRAEIVAKLTDLGFLGNATTTKKVEKKKEEKLVKKYSTEGERPLLVVWQGYSDLIDGTIKFEEADYKGTLKLSLPNNDGTCDGSYSLLSDGKGTWQISCTNNMAASGTLKWIEDGGVTGKGKDLNGKNVKFTVSKES